MKKIFIAATLLMISASAHAGTYSYEGVTVRVQDGCRSSSCISVNAPGYGSYNAGHQMKVSKVHKDTSRFASSRKEDAAPVAAAPAVEAAPAKTESTAPQPPVSDTAPAK